MPVISNSEPILGNLGNYFSKIVDFFNLNPKNVHQIKGGINSILIKYSEHNKNYLVKIPLNKFVIPEIFFLKELNKNNIPAPHVVHFMTNQDIFPYPFFIMDWIEGAQSFDSHINNKVAEKGGAVYAEELIKIHRIQVSGFGVPLDVEGRKWSSNSWLDALSEFLEINIDRNTPSNIFSKLELELIFSFTISNRKIKIRNPVLIHGDIPNGLMQIDPEIKLIAFIDPAGIIGGDFLYDVSSVYCINEAGEMGHGFMKGYRIIFNLHGIEPEEKFRLECLRLFHFFWKTCFFYERSWGTKLLKTNVFKQLSLLEDF